MPSDPTTGLAFRGGSAALRWTVRLLILGVLILCGFAPYNHEVGGPCRIVATAEAGVRAQLADEVVEVFVREGDTVAAGDAIARLALREERAGVERSTADLKRAKAHLKLLKNGTRSEDLALAEQKVELWELQLAFYSSELERGERLLTQSAIAQSEVDRTRQSRDAAKSGLESARLSLARANEGARPEEIEAAAAEVERIEAELRHFQELIGLGVVTSPLAGTVATKHLNARVGHAVQPGDLIALVQDTSTLGAEIAADQAAAVRVEKGMPVKLRLNGTHGELLTGVVTGVSLRTIQPREFEHDGFRSDRETLVEEALEDSETHHVRIDVQLDPTETPLVPGMTGAARIVIEEDRLWRALARPLLRFFRVEVWSWLP